MDTLTVEKLMQVLQEPNRPLLTLVLRTLGQDRTRAVLIATLHCEAQGGMLTKDGSRRRTPGGIFFQLVKERTTPQERQRLFLRPIAQKKHAQPQAPTWDEVQAIVTTLPQGEATVTLTLVGRPEAQAVQTPPHLCRLSDAGQGAERAAQGLAPGPWADANYLAGRD